MTEIHLGEMALLIPSSVNKHAFLALGGNRARNDVRNTLGSDLPSVF